METAVRDRNGLPPMHIDPRLFLESAISAETADFNENLLAQLSALPDQWSVPPRVVRQRREDGLGPFPIPPASPRAEWVEIPGAESMIRLRIVPPPEPARGAYLHIHGGGWTLGAAHHDDARLEAIADGTGLVAVSVEYRLAPEHPYPAGPDDCEAAALWLTENAPERFGTSRLTIGGESAGAHLSVVTLLRLRDRHGITPFSAANLTAGCYDLAMTPSARRWGPDKLILNTRDIKNFVGCFLPDGTDPAHPDISVLHADLSGMPPALFSVGTRDALLDDSLFMASRWQAAGNETEVAIFPGGCHVFQAFPLEITRQSHGAIDAFLTKHTAA
ncbi:MAG: alpha/beta hydrolase [Pseudomonadota bacterium]